MKFASTKEHYKMYKSGKKWIFANIVVVTFGLETINLLPNVEASNVGNVNTENVRSTSTTNADSTSKSSTSITNADSTSKSSTSITNADSTSKSSTSAANADSTSKSSTSATNADSTSESSTSTTNVDSTSKSSTSATNTDSTSESSTSTTNADSTSKSSTSATNTDSTSESSTSAANTDSTSKSSTSTTNADSTSKNSITPAKIYSTGENSTKVSSVANTVETTSSDVSISEQYNEEYRNQFHYSPSKNWMNDPNGVFYDDTTGLYNLYYQYNPDGNQWGNMSWGHAVSTDMINWKEVGIAIPMLENQGKEDFTYTNTTGSLSSYGQVRYVGVPTTNGGNGAPDGKKMIFSGSIYVDKNNVSGLGKNAILAFYTANYSIGTRINDGKDNGLGTWLGYTGIQEQQLAYSLDGGKTFIQYSSDGNSSDPLPIIPVTASRGGDAANFRDPNVVYDEKNKNFYMTVVSDQQALIYKSKDLLHWTYSSNIVRQNDVGDGVWECPSLIPMTVAGTNDQKWVFCVSVQQGTHATGSGMQYYVGTMDANGKWSPESDQTMINPMTMDYGEDFYAGIPFANLKDGRTVMIAWESNWSYTGDSNTDPWYGNMTLPRELTLVKNTNSTDEYLLENQVVPEISHNEQNNVIPVQSANVNLSANELKKVNYSGHQYKISATFSWNKNDEPKSVGFKLRTSDDGKYDMFVGYDLTTKLLFVQRLNSGEPNMGSPRDHMNAYVDTEDGTITITVYVDETSVEVFANDGEKSITQNFFMRPEYIGNQDTGDIYLYSQDGKTAVTNLTVNPISSVWKENSAEVLYVDDTTGDVLSVQDLYGQSGTTDSYRTADTIKKYEAEGYALVSDNYPKTGTVYNQSNVIKMYKVHLIHNTEKSTEFKTVNEIVHYIYKNGKKAVDDYAATPIKFTRTVSIDAVTGDKTYGAWTPVKGTSFAAVVSPILKGYTADKLQIDKQIVNGNSKDLSSTVVYTKNSPVVTTESKTINEIVHYVYKNGEKAANDYVAIPIKFTRTVSTDAVTGDKTYGAWIAVKGTDFAAVASPIIKGYTPNQATITKINDVNENTPNIVKTVIYVKNEGAITSATSSSSVDSNNQSIIYGNSEGDNSNPKTVTSAVIRKDAVSNSKVSVKESLPQTGEERSDSISILGIILIALGSIGSLFGFRRKEIK
ncbi:MAG: GH32 C-terminal domain-containing protein [Liquorilactobacillus ghanensis]|uniref:mucin-binding protein n=3 Tax=Liquorilactobacillus ghanensis TaxID=399370 RepID=UPI0039EA165F